MTPGPKKGKGPAKKPGQHVDNASAAWGNPTPVWVMALARAADLSSLKQAGERVGYSLAAISQTINRKYQGDMDAIEKAVRGVLLAEKLDCPVQGMIPANACLDNQRQTMTTANRQAVRLAQTCPTCSHRSGGHHG